MGTEIDTNLETVIGDLQISRILPVGTIGSIDSLMDARDAIDSLINKGWELYATEESTVIKKIVEDGIDAMCCRIGSALNIKTGDISPENNLAMERIEEQLCDSFGIWVDGNKPHG